MPPLPVMGEGAGRLADAANCDVTQPVFVLGRYGEAVCNCDVTHLVRREEYSIDRLVILV